MLVHALTLSGPTLQGRTEMANVDTALRRKILRVMNHAPTKPPYRVALFGRGRHYISGAACNICVGTFSDADDAQRIANLCNDIAGLLAPAEIPVQ